MSSSLVAAATGSGPASSSGASSHACEVILGAENGPDGEPARSRWGCLGRACWATPLGSSTDQWFVVKDLAGAVLEGVTVKVCGRADPLCTSPVETATTTEYGTLMRLPLAAGFGFDGFLRLDAPDLDTTMYFPRPPITRWVDRARVVTAVDRARSLQFFEAAGVSPDPARGHVVLLTLGCALRVVAGVRVRADPQDAATTTVYTTGVLPSSSDESNASGLVVILNLPPGEVTLTATLAADGSWIGRTTVVVVAGAISSTQVPPSP